MAKKSTAKTSKKKTAAKKKTGAGKNTAAKAKPKKKAVKKAAAKKTAKKAPAKKTAQKAPAKKKMTVKDLMKKTFDRWQPDSLYTPPKDDVYEQGFAAPPFVADDAMREVLNRKFDFDFAAIAKPPKPKRTLKELMHLKFDRWQPAALYAPPEDKTENFTAPPFVTDDAMRSVLTRKFDFDFAAVAKPPKPKRTLEELMNLKFDRWQPASLYTPPKDEAYEKGFAAPPFVTDDAMREVLTRKFDFDFAEEFAKAEVIRKAEEERLAAERKAEEERLAAEEAERMAKIKEEAAKELEQMKAETEAQEKAEVKQLEEGDAPTIEPPPAAAEADPMEKAVKYLVAALVILFTIITAASYTNSSKFYLVPKGDTLQVWKGHFSPLGKAKIATLNGVPVPETVKPLYTKAEAFTLAFDYFLNQADEMLKASAPDMEGLKSVLKQASVFAFTDDFEQTVQARMTRVHLMNYLFQSDAAAVKGSVADLEQARSFLEEAALLPLTETQTQLVEQKLNAIRGMIESSDVANAAAPAEEDTEEKIEAEKPAAEEAPVHKTTI